MRMAEFGFFSFSLLLGLPPFTGGLRPPMLKTGTARCRLAFEGLWGTVSKSRPAAQSQFLHFPARA
jgi:hypothetical protein